MKRRFTRFWTLAMAGYGFVVLLLATGMILAVWRFDAIARGHVGRIRSEENRITLAERLRWSGEAIVSTGRGYLISTDPAFLTQLDEAQARFDRGIAALMEGASDAPGITLLGEVETDARRFRSHQDTLVQAIGTEDVRALAHRFEAELVPLQRELGHSLDRMIAYKEAAIGTVYDQVARERTRLRSMLNGLLGVLILGSVVIAAYVASLLGRSFRKEQEALETARRAVAARDEIMGMVAHDLRNPLASICLRAEVMRETNTREAIHEHTGFIVGLAGRMDSLIRSMLDVTTIESGHFTVHPEACEVEGLLKETNEMLAGLAARKQITIERLANPGARVLADRERVLQVLANLAGNAIKFAPEHGRVEVAATRHESDVCFRVSDNGPGIAREHVPHVFERFWKHEATGKKGTGLGLFIAKGIVEAHGGRIWVESESGHGATFRFTLPCETPLLSPTAATSNQGSDSERRLQHLHS